MTQCVGEPCSLVIIMKMVLFIENLTIHQNPRTRISSLKQTEKVRLENLQYRAAKLVTGTFQFSSQQKLNIELGWETIQVRSDILGLNIFQKIHKKETRPLISKCMPKVKYETTMNLRSFGGYLPYPSNGIKFSKSFFPYFF